jgi:hypothetical protein
MNGQQYLNFKTSISILREINPEPYFEIEDMLHITRKTKKSQVKIHSINN